MASITSSGIGSGLDVAGIVQQLVAAEAAPVETRIAQQEARTQSKLSSYGSLNAALADFLDKLEVAKSTTSFLVRKATSEDTSLFSVTASENALPATYSIEIERLAQAQKLTSGAYVDADSEVGTGTLTVAVDVLSFDIEIDEETNTLAGIRDAINNAPDNVGVAATIVNADAGSYLILTGEKTGAANSITVTQAGGDGGLSSLAYDPANGVAALTESVTAQDALVRVDGFDILSATNSVTGAIDGVALDLITADPGNSASLQVQNDEDAVRDTIQGFVDSYNQLIETFDQLTAYNAENEIAAPLLGDATVRSMREQIRREFSTAISNTQMPFTTLTEIGIENQLDGKLSLDESDLADVLGSEFNQVGQLFAAEDGFAVRLFDLIDGFLATDGILEVKTQGFASRIDDIADERDALGERLASLETRLLRQFNALDSLIAQLTSTSSFLTQQLDNLPGFSRDKSRG